MMEESIPVNRSSLLLNFRDPNLADHHPSHQTKTVAGEELLMTSFSHLEICYFHHVLT